MQSQRFLVRKRSPCARLVWLASFPRLKGRIPGLRQALSLRVTGQSVEEVTFETSMAGNYYFLRRSNGN